MNRWRKCHRFLCAHPCRKQLRVAQRNCALFISGRIRANTGDQFFCYGRNFDMMYDTHKVKIGVFLLPK